MCLGIPGKIVSISASNDALSAGKIDFNGIIKEVCLAYVPEAKVGDYVIIHAGFAISIVDAEEARLVFQYLEELDAAVAQEKP